MNESQTAQVVRLKQYFPFRICYGAVKGDQFIANTATTMRPLNKLVREGWQVFKAAQ